MANQYFSKVSAVAKQIDNLTISNNLRVGSTSNAVNSIIGDGTAAAQLAESVGGIMFAEALATPALLKLTCVSTSTTGVVLTGCRWFGIGQVGFSKDINESEP